MEFTFDLNELFKHEITKIPATLLPPEFRGDRRKQWDTQKKISDIINAMGEASAAAQNLTKPITTSERLKNSEHSLYLFVDPKGQKGKGCVMGLLKMGRKGLYIFDRDGQHHQLQPLCVLDFYIHEAMQRKGLGKKLFEHMLREEHTQPVRLAIDRPSDKFLGFLQKYYDLTGPIPQMNNFVVFDGFFLQNTKDEVSPTYEANHNNTHAKTNGTPTKSQNGVHNSSFGRYGAPRPLCSMGQIIHNHSATVQPTEPSSDSYTHASAVPHLSPKLERPRSLSLHPTDEADSKEDDNNKQHHADEEALMQQLIVEKLNAEVASLHLADGSTHGHSRVKISERENNIIHSDNSGAYTPRTPSNLTEQGYKDLKFYHSRLW